MLNLSDLPIFSLEIRSLSLDYEYKEANYNIVTDYAASILMVRIYGFAMYDRP
jgi:hypothetical protein